MKPMSILWAVTPAELNRIEQLPGIAEYVTTTLPDEGDLITHPYLADPATHLPCPLRVAKVLLGYPRPGEVTVVVSRPQ